MRERHANRAVGHKRFIDLGFFSKVFQEDWGLGVGAAPELGRNRNHCLAHDKKEWAGTKTFTHRIHRHVYSINKECTFVYKHH